MEIMFLSAFILLKMDVVSDFQMFFFGEDFILFTVDFFCDWSNLVNHSVKAIY